jgi:hypothetical protein
MRVISCQFSLTFDESETATDTLIHFSGDKSIGNYFCDKKIYTTLLTSDASSLSESIQSDPLAEAFYRMNCLQEFQVPVTKQDAFGRFDFDHSIQSRDENPYTDKVSELFISFLSRFGIKKTQVPPRRRVLLSHDIDILHGGLRSELKYILSGQSQMKFSDLISHLSRKHKLWNTINDIVQIEKEQGVHSIFYFLSTRGIYKGINHADYTLQEAAAIVKEITSQGAEAGLHKSAADHSYIEESIKLDFTAPMSNRNHYLRYKLPEDWEGMEAAGIKTDTGLGWSKTYGLRNSYAHPFHPFTGGRTLDLLCIPLVLMDTTFAKHFRAEDIVPAFQTMVQSWSNGFTVSVLFHNNYLSRGTNHKFLQAYQDLLQYLKESNIETVSTAQILEEYTG